MALHKVKAHQKLELLEDGSEAKFQALGNDLVEQWAKEGAELHRIPQAVREDWDRHREQNIQILKYVVAALVNGLSENMV